MSRVARSIALHLRRLLAELRTRVLARLPEAVIHWLKLTRDIPEHLRALRRSSSKARREAAQHEVSQLLETPLISLVMPTYQTELRYLREALDSVREQVYPEWELCLVDDGSEDPGLIDELTRYAATDPRIRFEALSSNTGISTASNRGLAMCRGEFVGFLDHDDALTPDALLRVAQAFVADPSLDVVYSDSDKLTAKGVRADPFLKPDWSPVYALGAMYIGHLLVLRRGLAEDVGGFDPAFDKIQDFEFMLRVSERTNRIAHIPQILYHWRAIPGSIAAGAEEKSGVPKLQARAVSAHLKRRGIKSRALPHPTIPHRAVLAATNEGNSAGSIAIVIAAHGEGSALERLLTSVDALDPAPTETIVVTGPDSDTKAAETHGVRILVAGPKPFCRAHAHNLGAEAANADHLLFIAEDCELTDSDTLDQLLLHAVLPNVAAVGPLLVRPDNRVEGAGFAIGMKNAVAPMAPDAIADGDGYYGSLPCSHEVSAISSECMLVRRDDLLKAGGFNEAYSQQFEDFDLCRRLVAGGRACIYAARPRVVCHRLPARRRAEFDVVDRALFVDCWYDDLVRGDPFFNPGFRRDRADYSPTGWRERVFDSSSRRGTL